MVQDDKESPIPSPEDSPPPANAEALQAKVKQQVEFYFSRDNLQTDQYLVSQMKQDSWVPVEVISQFGRVNTLTGDCDAIMEALKDSSVVTVDYETRMMRPKDTNDRSCLVIRDIEKDQDPSEILALFGAHAKNVLEVQPEIGNNWFCNLKDETSAMAALAHLQSLHHPDGSPLGVRIRSNNYCRGSAPGHSNPRRSHSPASSGSPMGTHGGPEFSPSPPSGASGGVPMTFIPNGAMLYTNDIHHQATQQYAGNSSVGTFLYSSTAPYQDYNYQFSNVSKQYPAAGLKGKSKGKDGSKRTQKVKGRGGRGKGQGHSQHAENGMNGMEDMPEMHAPKHAPNIWSKIVLGEKPDADQLAKYEEDMKAAGIPLPTMLTDQPLAPEIPAPASPPSSTEASPNEEDKRSKRRAEKAPKMVQDKTDTVKGGKGARRGRGRGDTGKGEDAEESWSRVDKGPRGDKQGKGGKNGKKAPSESGEASPAVPVVLPVPLPTPRVARGAGPVPPLRTPAPREPEATRPRKAVPKAAPAETPLPKPNQRKAATRKQEIAMPAAAPTNPGSQQDWLTVKGGEIVKESFEEKPQEVSAGFAATGYTELEQAEQEEEQEEEEAPEDGIQLRDPAARHRKKQGKKDNTNQKKQSKPRKQAAHPDVWHSQIARVVFGSDFATQPSRVPNSVFWGIVALLALAILYFVIFIL